MSDIKQSIRGYQILDKLGEGGFGTVYRAYQPLLKREVAIKAILSTFANSPDFIRRFEVEAEIIARLEHLHIVPLYDYWREVDGAYLVMRYLRGGSLLDIMDKQTFTTGQVMKLCDQITSALQVAHRNGIIHRDIKPGNILLDEDGNAYLTDFGIAKTQHNITSTDEGISGSVPYASPEQIQSGVITPQADIYSLGVMLYELLVGQHPYKGMAVTQMLMNHISEPLPDITKRNANLSPEVNDVIQKATQKDPTKRYDTVRELATALRIALSDEEITVQLPEPPIDADTHIKLPNPYKGLRAFQEADADQFFGRATLVQRLLDRMAEDSKQARFLAIIGPSGSGKSSVVKAGLLPALRRGGLPGSDKWFITEMFPDIYPFEELEAMLLRIAIKPPDTLLNTLKSENGFTTAVERILPDDGETELVLLIDQFEEMFTTVEDDEVRERFLLNLVEAVNDPSSRLRIIVTLRADFYDKPLHYHRFGELLRTRIETVLPLTPEELTEAIVEPANKVGARLQKGLVDTIIKEVHDQPGMLPLLQYALTELFERRTSRTMTLEDYRAIGGVTGALAKRAEELYSNMDEETQTATRQVFLRLITLGDGTEDTRRRVFQTELPDDLHTEEVLNKYGHFRLLTFDRDAITRNPSVEVAHEALIRTWVRLREWIDEDRDGLRTHRRLATAAQEWSNAEQDSSFLAMGSRLIQFETWAEKTDLILNDIEQQYLDVSIKARERQIQIEEERQAHALMLEHRAVRRLRYLLVGVSLFLIVAIALSIFAFGQQQEAQTSLAFAQTAGTAEAIALHDARRQAEVAQSLQLAAQAQLSSDVDTLLAIKLALASVGIEDPPALVRQIFTTIGFAPGPRHDFTAHTASVRSMAFSTDGTKAISSGDDATIILWNLETNEAITTYTGHTASVRAVAFTPDGRYVVSASDDQTIKLWDVESGEEVRTFTGHEGWVRGIDVSPDGKYILSGSADGTMKLWDVESGEEIRTYTGHERWIEHVTFSPDGQTALSASTDRTIILWDVVTGDIMHTFSGHTNRVTDVAFSPDGRTALSSSWDNTVKLWNIETGREIITYVLHDDEVNSVAFSPDGSTVLTASADQTIKQWDLASGEEIHIYRGHTDKVNRAVFSPDGISMLSGADDDLLKLWDVKRVEEIATLRGHRDGVASVDFNPDGQLAVSSSWDQTIKLWDMETLESIRTFSGHGDGIPSVVLSPDGSKILSGSLDFTVRLWDVATGQQIRTFGGHNESVHGVAFSPDGSQAISGSTDRTIRLWDVETGQELRRFIGHSNSVETVDFSPDATQIVSGSLDLTIKLWDVESGDEIRTFSGHGGSIRSVKFSPDGTRILSGSTDGTMKLWDVESGREIRTFSGHTGAVWHVSFSPDGLQALSASTDDLIKLWDIATGEELRTFSGHTDDVFTAVFSPDGQQILSGSQDNTLKLWDRITLADQIDWVCHNRVVVPLTVAERERYIIQSDISTCEN